jgi:signal transduction histidine kinase/CheY-like chemotaxis protein
MAADGSSAPIRRAWLARRAAPLLVAGVALVAFVGYLLYANYRAALTVRHNLLAQQGQNVELQAVALSSFLASAGEDLRYLAESREVATFYENRDLGMSMQYGLALSLVPIRARLDGLVAPSGRNPARFARVALLDVDGVELADTDRGDLPGCGDACGDATRLEPLFLSRDGRHLMMQRAHWFKGRYSGVFVAWLNPASVVAAMATQRERARGSWFGLVDAGGRTYRTDARGDDPPLDVAALLERVPRDGRVVELPAARGANGDLVAVRVPVRGQPLSILHVDRLADLAGELSPAAGARNLTLAAVAVLLAAVVALVLNVKSIVLEARLDESLRREQEVAGKHRALARAVAERRRLEAEEKDLRERLRHAQKLEAIGTLAGGVAHDFNNLLTVINGYAETAMDQLLESDPLRDDLREIRNAGTRAAELTRQLLAFGRRQMLKPVVLDLNGVVTGVEKMLRRLIGEHIELSTSLGDALPRVRVDPGQLEQVLVNLAVNARDAMPSGGRLTIATSSAAVGESVASHHGDVAPGEFVRLTVSDDGMGMDGRVLAHLFEPFFTTKEHGKGTGLGLSMVYGIVRQSRGFVEVTSSPGAGARFDVFLPAELSAATPLDAAPRARRTRPPGPRGTVLVAEDEVQVRMLLKSQLTSEGYQVLTASDGRDALEVASRHAGPIDLLLSDVVMPVMSGPELAQRFRAARPDAAVVFMSGYAEETVAGRGEIESAAGFVQKPYQIPELTALLRQVLDGRRAAAAAARAAS